MTAEQEAAYLDAALTLHELTVDPSWRDAILAHFRAIEAAARLMLDVPLPDHAEAAPVFTP